MASNAEYYEKLNGERIFYASLSHLDMQTLTKINDKAQSGVSVLDFVLWRIELLSKYYERKSYNDIINYKLFQIAQDIGQRLDKNQKKKGANSDISRSTNKGGSR